VVVRVTPEFFRPAEVDVLVGNSSKAYQELNWYPKISFEQLVKRMVQHDK
jgi:GDPmannose 4,6-dehydratase